MSDTPKPDKANRISKTERVHLRLTAAQKVMLESKAKQANKNINTFIIDLLENGNVYEPVPAQTRKDLFGLSGNLNQLLKFAHLGNFDSEPILEIIQELKKIILGKSSTK